MNTKTLKAICEAHLEVERELGIVVPDDTIREILSHCIRKLKVAGKDEAYLPILYRYELPMQLAMKLINRTSEFVRSVRKGGEEENELAFVQSGRRIYCRSV